MAELQVYKAMAVVGWGGWNFAPGPVCNCQCSEREDLRCTGQTATDCQCCGGRCTCNIKRASYGGDILFVQAGDSRLEYMTRYA